MRAKKQGDSEYPGNYFLKTKKRLNLRPRTPFAHVVELVDTLL
jgi:hypothetical protein